MIPASDITGWSVNHPWASRDDIEQDLLLSQAICEIANNQLLGNELILRGGTAFHKLFLPKPYRYSEDLDYVRNSAGGIGQVIKQLIMIGERLGYKANSNLAKFPKVFWKTVSESGQPIRIKIEINTYERTPAMPLALKHHIIEAEYYSSRVNIATFQPEELIATKIRALYQRSKGRDLLDIWLALELLKLEPAIIVDAFKIYRPDGITSALAIKNLERKLEDRKFLDDIYGLAVLRDLDYDIIAASEVVTEKLLRLL
ncbi:MAG: nucleotidyl transferase AbiEii/AbiGii toxin family protein [Dehalococcoidia bacterium]|nr:nucleotidyl transferase AbiEii/AbiGii toxin family protein [Dehalococcoidia bacterium]